MRILHISKYDQKGGASRAAFSSMLAQRDAGADAHLLVGIKQSDSPFVHAPEGFLRYVIYAGFVGEKLPELFKGGDGETRSLHAFGLSARKIHGWLKPDIVFAHKVDGLLPLREFARFSVPVIWRLHDMWPVCGTQHYAPEKQVLEQSSVEWKMPALARWIEAWVMKRKRQTYGRATGLVICPPSRWLADCLKRSPLFCGHRVEVIPNGVDAGIFMPQNQAHARAEFGLPLDKSIVLFGAAGGTADPRKGFALLISALRKLASICNSPPHLLVFGGDLPNEIAELGLSASSVGAIRDNAMLAKVYAAADVFVAPSRQENLSLTVLEALACGIPTVAFDIGGMPDMIRPGISGHLARPFDTAHLAEHIARILNSDASERARLRSNARKLICQEFSMQAEARQMLQLAESLVEHAA